MTDRRDASVTRDEFDRLVQTVTRLEINMEENTEITKDVRDIVGSFKVMMHIGKWVTVMAGMVAAVVAAVKGFRL